MAADDHRAPAPGEAPPRAEDRRSWGRLYALVLAWLAVTIIVLTALTWAYR